MKLWQCSACREYREDCRLQCQLITDDDIKPSQCIENRDVDQSVWSEIQPCDLLIEDASVYRDKADQFFCITFLPIMVAMALGVLTLGFALSLNQPDRYYTYVYISGIIACLVWFYLWVQMHSGYKYIRIKEKPRGAFAH